jgi:hypothetical protein
MIFHYVCKIVKAIGFFLDNVCKRLKQSWTGLMVILGIIGALIAAAMKLR